jgi:hypothetical protein
MLKKLLPILLLSLTYFIGQAYVWFDNEHYNAYGETSWIFDGSHAMPVSWNVKYLSEEINRILEAAAFLLMLKKNSPDLPVSRGRIFSIPGNGYLFLFLQL